MGDRRASVGYGAPMRIGAIGLVALLAAVAGCSGDNGTTVTRSVDNTGSAASADPAATETGTGGTAASGSFVAAAGVAPADADEIIGATDVRTMLASLGFPSNWLVPEGVGIADVAGVAVRQSTGDDLTTYRYLFGFWQPAGNPDDLAKSWYEEYSKVFGAPPASGSGTKTGNGVSGRLYSGGLPEDPGGRLVVTVVGTDGTEGATKPVVIEVEYKIVGPGATTTLQLSPELLNALPDITGCVPFLVEADMELYVSPNASITGPGYRTIYDGTCPDTATFDAAGAWAVGRDGIVNQDAEHVEVTDSTGSNGTMLHVRAGSDTSIRIDTNQPAAQPDG